MVAAQHRLPVKAVVFLAVLVLVLISAACEAVFGEDEAGPSLEPRAASPSTRLTNDPPLTADGPLVDEAARRACRKSAEARLLRKAGRKAKAAAADRKAVGLALGSAVPSLDAVRAPAALRAWCAEHLPEIKAAAPLPAKPRTKKPRATSAETSRPEPTPRPEPSADDLDPRFPTCGAANDAGYGPYHAGETEYSWYVDRDHDGVVCER